MKKICSFIFLSICVYAVSSMGGADVGPGHWVVLNIAGCEPEPGDKLAIQVESEQVDRFNTRYRASFNLTVEMPETTTTEVEMLKDMDGGFKPYQMMADDMMIMVAKYAEEHVLTVMAMADMGTGLPLSAGYYTCEGFKLDMCSFGTSGPYSLFEVNVKLLMDGARIACVTLLLEFKAYADDEEQCPE